MTPVNSRCYVTSLFEEIFICVAGVTLGERVKTWVTPLLLPGDSIDQCLCSLPKLRLFQVLLATGSCLAAYRANPRSFGTPSPSQCHPSRHPWASPLVTVPRRHPVTSPGDSTVTQ